MNALVLLSWPRRACAWLVQGEIAYGWFGWFVFVGAFAVERPRHVVCWGLAALVVLHEFAALRRRNDLLVVQLSSGRWLRRLDDAYFDAIRRTLAALEPEERGRFDRLFHDVNGGQASSSHREAEGDHPNDEDIRDEG